MRTYIIRAARKDLSSRDASCHGKPIRSLVCSAVRSFEARVGWYP